MRFSSLMVIVLLLGIPGLARAAESDPAAPSDSTEPAASDSTAPSQPDAPKPPAAPTARPVVVQDPKQVSVAHVHLVFERKGHSIDVTQTLRLTVEAGQIFRSKVGYSIPLPEGALAPRPVGENKEPYRVAAHGVDYLLPIDAKGVDVIIAFKLPIRDGRVSLRQQFDVPVRSAQLISTWTKKDPVLKGVGFGEPRALELNSGMMALVMNGGELADGRIEIVFSGLAAPEGELEQLFALLASLALLALGLIFWVRDYVRGRS